MENLIEHPAYSKNAIEFVAVATESASFFENSSSFEKKEFLERTAKLLAIIYLKASMLTDVEPVLDEAPETFVTENDYEYVRQNISTLLGDSDAYLDVFHPDIQLSETPIAATISENIADIYQDLKDFSMRYQVGNNDVMNDALSYCYSSFKEYWGQKLVNALRAVHEALYNKNLSEEDEYIEETGTKLTKDSFFNNMKEDDLGELDRFFEK